MPAGQAAVDTPGWIPQHGMRVEDGGWGQLTSLVLTLCSSYLTWSKWCWKYRRHFVWFFETIHVLQVLFLSFLAPSLSQLHWVTRAGCLFVLGLTWLRREGHLIGLVAWNSRTTYHFINTCSNYQIQSIKKYLLYSRAEVWHGISSSQQRWWFLKGAAGWGFSLTPKCSLDCGWLVPLPGFWAANSYPYGRLLPAALAGGTRERSWDWHSQEAVPRPLLGHILINCPSNVIMHRGTNWFCVVYNYDDTLLDTSCWYWVRVLNNYPKVVTHHSTAEGAVFWMAIQKWWHATAEGTVVTTESSVFICLYK